VAHLSTIFLWLLTLDRPPHPDLSLLLIGTKYTWPSFCDYYGHAFLAPANNRLWCDSTPSSSGKEKSSTNVFRIAHHRSTIYSEHFNMRGKGFGLHGKATAV
jgi:hypothetical protein